MNRLLIFILFSSFCQLVIGQELNCQVKVTNAPSLQLSANDIEVLEELEKAIFEFMNDTRWTKDNFEIEERINCNMLITMKEKKGTDSYAGQIQVQSSRPVFNTSYNTTVFNMIDPDFNITYLRNTALLFSIDQYRDNLTSILAYYAYMILGYDYDSFSMEGGTEFFNKAQQIANNAIPSGDGGWDSGGGKNKNRYWVVDNVLQSMFKPLRQAIYKYHREGFDIMRGDLIGGRKMVVESLQLLDKVQKSRPGSINIQIFMSGKQDEIINLFSQAEMAEKNTVVNLCKRLDPAGSSKYQEILN